MTDNSTPDIPERYSRQARFAGLGPQGQAKLMRGRAVLCGCGALGTVLAETLVRAGIGSLRIVDRDFVEISNLQRQVLFDEVDVAAQLPKAIAAAQKLSRINSSVRVEPIVADINHHNIRELFADVDVILDGTDNFETRFLMNDAALELGTPWTYGGCVGSHGQTFTIFPGQSACLRCVIESPPEPGSSETCDTAGVLGPAIQVVASLQAIAAMKLLSGQADQIAQRMTIIDVWDGTFRTVNLANVRERANCPACIQGERKWLQGDASSLTTVLCGRNAVQVTPASPAQLDLPAFARRWADLGRVMSNPFLVRLNASAGDLEVTLFRDGRAIVKGTDDPTAARTAYAKYVGG
ncbi:MAG: thiamine biosynthesis protein ThiF [Planctomycetales bacterium 12-60-4]|nr:MAG: thiamine biosynthesis protein ThiF [Planctomycetales bacterium 12-60-4]